MKKWRLTTQLNVVFTVATIVVGIIFIIVFDVSFNRIYEDQNKLQLQQYLSETVENVKSNRLFDLSPINGYCLDYRNNPLPPTIHQVEEKPILKDNQNLYNYIEYLWANQPEINTNFSYDLKDDNKTVYLSGRFIDALAGDPDPENQMLILVFTDNRYATNIRKDFIITVQITFLTLMLFGNLIILLWSRTIVARIKILQNNVLVLPSTQYKKEIKVDGYDEIALLAQAIEQMRQEIVNGEKAKQQILQNLSHDFKTPITVIQTYAEAIQEGVSDVSDIKVIVEQANILTHKVKQLLELNRLEYLKDPNEFTDIQVKYVIERIVNNYKYKFSNIKTDLDDSIYRGVEDNLEIAIANIIDNAVRYAKSVIKITLKDKKLTIYNDGEPIDEKTIKSLYKPYEKGARGEFGLGLSISKTTFTHFSLDLEVENVDGGVAFIIKPHESE